MFVFDGAHAGVVGGGDVGGFGIAGVERAVVEVSMGVLAKEFMCGEILAWYSHGRVESGLFCFLDFATMGNGDGIALLVMLVEGLLAFFRTSSHH